MQPPLRQNPTPRALSTFIYLFRCNKFYLEFCLNGKATLPIEQRGYGLLTGATVKYPLPGLCPHLLGPTYTVRVTGSQSESNPLYGGTH